MNKKAIVTGGSRGIGAAIVTTLANNGYDVVFNYRNDSKAAETTVHAASESGSFIKAFKADITEYIEATTFINQAKESLGEVDLLVNNAGVELIKPVAELSLEDWRWITSINLDGVFLVFAAIGFFMKLLFFGSDDRGQLIEPCFTFFLGKLSVAEDGFRLGRCETFVKIFDG